MSCCERDFVSQSIYYLETKGGVDGSWVTAAYHLEIRCESRCGKPHTAREQAHCKLDLMQPQSVAKGSTTGIQR